MTYPITVQAHQIMPLLTRRTVGLAEVGAVCQQDQQQVAKAPHVLSNSTDDLLRLAPCGLSACNFWAGKDPRVGEVQWLLIKGPCMP